MSARSEASWSDVSGPALARPAGFGDRAALESLRQGNFGPAMAALLAAAFQPEHEAQERLLGERRAAASAAAERLQALAEQRAALEAAAAAEASQVQALREERAGLEDGCAAAAARLAAARAVAAALEGEAASQRRSVAALADAERGLRCGLEGLRGDQAQLEWHCGLLEAEVEAADRRRAGLLEEAAEAEAQFKRWLARLASVASDLSMPEGQLRTRVAELEASLAELVPALEEDIAQLGEQHTAQLGEASERLSNSQARVAELEAALAQRTAQLDECLAKLGNRRRARSHRRARREAERLDAAYASLLL